MKSSFTGGLLGQIGISILCGIIIIITFGIGVPWAVCISENGLQSILLLTDISFILTALALNFLEIILNGFCLQL